MYLLATLYILYNNLNYFMAAFTCGSIFFTFSFSGDILAASSR